MAFFGKSSQQVSEISGSIDGVDYTSRSEVMHHSFNSFLALGLDVYSPSFLKRLMAVFGSNYNLGLYRQQANATFELDEETVYSSSVSTRLNHLNLLLGIRYRLLGDDRS